MEDFLIGFCIVCRQRLQIDLLAPHLLDQLERIVENRQRRQPEEVHLQEPKLLDGLHVIRGYDFLVLRQVNRHKIRKRLRRNHYTRRMYPRVAHESFQLLCHIDDLPHLRLVFICLRQRRRILQRLIDGDVQRRGNHLRDPIHLRVGHIHHSADVLDRRLRRHRAEGDDLRHILAPVFLGHVLDHLAAPIHAEVDVDIGHAHALWIQKALEQQLVLQRIHIRDRHRIGDERARSRSAPRSYWNPVFFRVTDEIPHDHEVTGELHLLDDLNFPRQPLLVVADLMFQPSLCLQLAQQIQPSSKSFTTHSLKVAVDIHSRRYIESREGIAHLIQFEIAPLGDRQSALQHVGLAAEDLLHLLVALDEELVGLELHAVFFSDRFAGLYADHHVLGVSIVLTQVVAVIGRNHRNAQFAGDSKLIGKDLVFLRESLVLHFNKEVPRAEDVVESSRRLL